MYYEQLSSGSLTSSSHSLNRTATSRSSSPRTTSSPKRSSRPVVAGRSISIVVLYTGLCILTTILFGCDYYNHHHYSPTTLGRSFSSRMRYWMFHDPKHRPPKKNSLPFLDPSPVLRRRRRRRFGIAKESKRKDAGVPTRMGAMGDHYYYDDDSNSKEEEEERSFVFHSICDILLFQNLDYGNGMGLEIHIRTSQQQQQQHVLISSAAIRMGTDTFEITTPTQPQSSSKDTTMYYWVNGISSNPSTLPKLFQDELEYMTIQYESAEDRIPTQFTIPLPHHDSNPDTNTTIVFSTNHTKNQIHIQIRNPSYDLLRGNSNESVGGLLVELYPTNEENEPSSSSSSLLSYDPDTTNSTYPSTTRESWVRHEQKWQVQEWDPKLFHNDGTGPQSPEKCFVVDPSSSDSKSSSTTTLPTTTTTTTTTTMEEQQAHHQETTTTTTRTQKLVSSSFSLLSKNINQ